MKIIEKMMKEKDDLVTFYHQKKDFDSLKTSLSQLIEEHDHIKKDLNSVNYLLDLVEKHNINELESLTNEYMDHEHLTKWFEKIKISFEKLHLKNEVDLNISDKEFIKTEKSKLVVEKTHLEKHLSSLDGIIAKSRALVKNLSENFCSDLTTVDNIEAVGKKLMKKFKGSLQATYSTGRKDIINFLESTYKINKIKSKELFDLLAYSGIIEYKIDDSNIDDIQYFDYYNEGI